MRVRMKIWIFYATIGIVREERCHILTHKRNVSPHLYEVLGVLHKRGGGVTPRTPLDPPLDVEKYRTLWVSS